MSQGGSEAPTRLVDADFFDGAKPWTRRVDVELCRKPPGLEVDVDLAKRSNHCQVFYFFLFLVFIFTVISVDSGLLRAEPLVAFFDIKESKDSKFGLRYS